MHLRREKGLCYYCDDRFSFQHRCPNKHLFLLQLDDSEAIEPEIDPLTLSLTLPQPDPPDPSLYKSA
jgi:hypothetical protein